LKNSVSSFFYLQQPRRRKNELTPFLELRMKPLPTKIENPAAALGATGKLPLTIGWKEYVDFPDWGIRRVKVKVDTGARTSALDVVSYDLRQTDTGLVADLRLALSRKHPERVTVVSVPVLKIITVSSSTGIWERRPLMEAEVRLGPITKRVRLTVTNRSRMLFRMILGRKVLEGDFVVDVSKKYLLRP
jgi:hypothetical protein